MWFTSDNAGPAHPAVLEALAAANRGYAASYGDDEAMARVRARLREVFEAPDAAVYLVATGTAANALGLACLCPPWATVYCHREAHAEVDECGAPEFYTGGAKLTLLDGAHGRIAPGSLAAALAPPPACTRCSAARSASPTRPRRARSTARTRWRPWPRWRARRACRCTWTARASPTRSRRSAAPRPS